MRLKKGFTIIELLVVIAVVGILSSVTIVSFKGAQASSRDSKRKADLNSIAAQLEMYKSRNGNYPSTEYKFQDASTTQNGIIAFSNSWGCYSQAQLNKDIADASGLRCEPTYLENFYSGKYASGISQTYVNNPNKVTYDEWIPGMINSIYGGMPHDPKQNKNSSSTGYTRKFYLAFNNDSTIANIDSTSVFSYMYTSWHQRYYVGPDLTWVAPGENYWLMSRLENPSTKDNIETVCPKINKYEKAIINARPICISQQGYDSAGTTYGPTGNPSSWESDPTKNKAYAITNLTLPN